MTTVSNFMKAHTREAMKVLAIAASVLVYVAGLVYAGVRSFDLFARTLPPDMLPLAALGIVAAEVTALALPVAIHYWTVPGMQRIVALGFYMVDMVFIVCNSILDAAYNSGAIVPEFMTAYGVWVVPALPVVCMVGWALVWALDPSSREHDMEMQVQAATHSAVMEQIINETAAQDVSEEVRAAAAERARAIVRRTLGAPAPRAQSEAIAPLPKAVPVPSRNGADKIH